MLRLILLFFLCFYNGISVAHAHNDTKRIQFLGLQNISKKEALHYLSVNGSHRINANDVKSSIIKLSSTGLFDDITVSEFNNSVIFKVKEKPIISSIICLGNFKISRSTLIKQFKSLDLKVKHVFDKNLINVLQNRLQVLYDKHGFYNTKINVDYQIIKNNYCILKAYISEGIPKILNNINITGNKVFSKDKIISFFSSYPNFFQRNIFHNKQYDDSIFTSDLAKLKHFYVKNGYINFHVKDIKFISLSNENNFLINIKIHEGSQYILSSVILHGDLKQYDHIFQSELSSVKLSHTYNLYDIIKLQHKIQNILLNFGFLKGKVFIHTILDQIKKHVFSNLYITLGPRFILNKIEIQGNILEHNQLLHHAIQQLSPGSYANLKLIEQGKHKLIKTGYVKHVSVNVQVVPGTFNKVNVIYKLEEKEFNNFNVRMGYNIAEGVTCDVQYQHNNLIGFGVDTIMDVVLSRYRNDMNCILKYPNNLESIICSHRIFYNTLHSNDANPLKTTSEVYGVEENLKFLKLKNNVITISANYNCNDSISSDKYLFPIDKLRTLKNNKNIFLKNQFISNVTIAYSWLYDTLPKVNFPTSGHKFLFDGKIFLNSYHKKFHKESLYFEKYIPILKSSKYILRTRIRTGIEYPLENTNYPYYEGFYIQDNNNIRGFVNKSIVPKLEYVNKNQLEDGKKSSGGNSFIVGKLDLIIPNFFIFHNYDNKFFRTSLFFDFCDIYNVNWQSCMHNMLYKMKNYNHINNLHASTGMEIVWNSPMGLLHFSYSYPLFYNISDILKNLQFNMSSN